MLVQFDTGHGLYVLFRRASEDREAIGFKIKWKRRMLFSERNGFARGFCIGPVYFGLFGKGDT